jgi:uncharacterized lipoprotein YddW (UPF0748 family)
MLRTILASIVLGTSAAPALAQELRGVWIANTGSAVLESRQGIVAALEACRAHGLNAVYPVMWSKGLTCYPSAVAEGVVGARIDPRYGERDPLAQMVYEAHRRGIEVVAWLEYGFAAEHAKRPTNLLKRHPDWAAMGPDGKRVVKNDFTWANSFDPRVQRFLADIVLEVAREHDVDGVQGDDRLPAVAATAGYDKATLKAWSLHSKSSKKPALDDPEWKAWRAGLLSDWMAALRGELRAAEGLQWSSSPSCYPWGLDEYLQDAKAWVERGLVDAIHPQVYRKDLDAYVATLKQQVRELRRAGGPLFAPGVLVKAGDYVIEREHLLGAVAANREQGCAGEIHFFLEGLREKDDHLLRALRAGPYAADALAPWRMAKPRPAPVEALADEEGRAVVRAPLQGAFDVWLDRADWQSAKRAPDELEVGFATDSAGGSREVRLQEGLARLTRVRLAQGEALNVVMRTKSGSVAVRDVRVVLLATRDALR